YKANQGSNYIPSRGITDGKYKLIWNCNTVFPSGARQSFQWKMPSYRDWESHYRKGEYSGIQSYFFEPMVTFEFYDLEFDPNETINLASDPAYAELLDEHIAALQAKVRSTNDIGFFPNSLRNNELSGVVLYDWVRDNNFDMEKLYQAVELASMAEAEDLVEIVDLLENPEAAIRYWGAVGMLRLRFHDKISELPAIVKDLANNTSENIEVRCLSHAALLCNEEYCECSSFLASNLTETYCQGIIPNLGDKLRPIAGELYKAGMKTSDFYVKSTLINAGVMPYEQLIDVTNVTINQALLDSLGILDCSCETKAITPYLRINDGSWQQSASASMEVGDTIKFGPQPIKGGTWSWSGPNGFTASTREITISDIQTNEAGDYVAYYTNACGTKSTQTYAISIKSNAYYFDHVGSGLRMTSNSTGTDAITTSSTDNGALAQWSLVDANNGYFYIQNQSNGMKLQGTSSITQDEASVKIVSNTNEGSWAQWELTQTGSNWFVNNKSFNTRLNYNGTSISVGPTTWTGPWVQWKLTNVNTGALKSAKIDEPNIEINKSILPEVFYIGDGSFKPELDHQVINYHFNVYNINGVKVFSSQDPNIGWEGSNPSTPLYLWSLQYQTSDNKTVLQSGKVMVFVD
ncbi:hypothetical protein OAA06_02195, partial [bacterium]|nr:hypothetical protein [bacterium]